MVFKNFEEFQAEVNKKPPGGAFIDEDGIKWLRQDYAIHRMNEVFGEGNWNIEKIKKMELKDERGQSLGNTCVLTVSFEHPLTGDLIKREGVSGTDEGFSKCHFFNWTNLKNKVSIQ